MVGNSFQMIGAATEKARLPRFSFVLGIESCCEVDDRSCLSIIERVPETPIIQGCSKWLVRNLIMSDNSTKNNDTDSAFDCF